MSARHRAYKAEYCESKVREKVTIRLIVKCKPFLVVNFRASSAIFTAPCMGHKSFKGSEVI